MKYFRFQLIYLGVSKVEALKIFPFDFQTTLKNNDICNYSCCCSV